MNIKISPDDNFVAIIGQVKMHSFFAIGVMQGEQLVLLSRIGLTAMGEKHCCCCSDAHLASESLVLEGNCSYVAYSINYQHYLHYKDQIGQHNALVGAHGKKLGIYDQDFAYIYPVSSCATQQTVTYFKKSRTLNLFNTCRNVSISVLKDTLRVSKIRQVIPSLFFCSLPCKTTFSEALSSQYDFVLMSSLSDKTKPEPGKIYVDKSGYVLLGMDGTAKAAKFAKEIENFDVKTLNIPYFKSSVIKAASKLGHIPPVSLRTQPYFYVFPLPPEAYDNMSAVDRMVLNKIFNKMEHLITIAPNAQATIDKFKALKALYEQRAGQPNQRIDVILTSINNWKNNHQDQISVYRGSFSIKQFFKLPPGTVKLVDDLNSFLKNSPGTTP